MAPTDRFTHSSEFYVRYVETDAQRVVNHVHYISWFEESRSAYARNRGADYADFEREGFGLAVIEVGANYRNPARFGDIVRVTCWVIELKSRTVTFGYEVHNAKTGLLLMSGHTRHMCMRLDGAAMVLPERWRHILTTEP